MVYVLANVCMTHGFTWKPEEDTGYLTLSFSALFFESESLGEPGGFSFILFPSGEGILLCCQA